MYSTMHRDIMLSQIFLNIFLISFVLFLPYRINAQIYTLEGCKNNYSLCMQDAQSRKKPDRSRGVTMNSNHYRNQAVKKCEAILAICVLNFIEQEKIHLENKRLQQEQKRRERMERRDNLFVQWMPQVVPANLNSINMHNFNPIKLEVRVPIQL